MPPYIKRSEQNVNEELLEFSNGGPFGGVQSEVPLDQVEQFGMVDVLNMVLRKSAAETRPGYTVLPAYPVFPEDTVGIADFYTNAATRVQVVMTLTRLIKWDQVIQNWVDIPGAVHQLTGGTSDLFTWTVVNNILCFCQGVDTIQGWDGITATFGDISPDAFPAKYLMELETHLVAAYTIETGTPHTQRVRWSGAGDPTDWISPSSGTNDILGDLGPITGAVKIFQSGYIFHQWGITQMIPTGVGTNPFRFIPITTRARGNTIPYSLAPSGEEFACYVGKDNVYKFDGTVSEPIGDKPMQNNKRFGARSRIFADLSAVNQQTVSGYISDMVNGQVFPAYWLVIPMVSVWIYNLDEQTWLRFSFEKVLSIVGRFFRGGTIRWLDLVGTWAQQGWTWASLAAQNPYDSVLLAFNDGTDGNFDFTNVSERDWLMSGVFIMGDNRHAKTIQKFRVTIYDQGQVTFTVRLANQFGQVVTQTVTMGTNSGNNISTILTMKLTGIRINWSISGGAGQDVTIVEFAPMYNVAGEQRGGIVDA